MAASTRAFLKMVFVRVRAHISFPLEKGSFAVPNSTFYRYEGT